MPILETSKLSKAFGANFAVKDADITIEKGYIYGLLGPNGSGKSTFMKMVAGLFYPTKGWAKVMGVPVGTATKKYVAFMSTEQFFYRHMTVKQVGQFYSDFYEDFDFARYEQLINFMELDMNMKVGSLSSGMNAKLRVAATMSRKALLYMLDEPLNGIDMIAQDKIMKTIIEQSNENNAIIISSHLISIMESILDRVIMIKKGKIVLQGSAEDIRENKGKSIVDVYREVFANA
jgi:ABC-2 type transport system ATP-binding protein